MSHSTSFYVLALGSEHVPVVMNIEETRRAANTWRYFVHPIPSIVTNNAYFLNSKLKKSRGHFKAKISVYRFYFDFVYPLEKHVLRGLVPLTLSLTCARTVSTVLDETGLYGVVRNSLIFPWRLILYLLPLTTGTAWSMPLGDLDIYEIMMIFINPPPQHAHHTHIHASMHTGYQTHRQTDTQTYTVTQTRGRRTFLPRLREWRNRDKLYKILFPSSVSIIVSVVWRPRRSCNHSRHTKSNTS